MYFKFTIMKITLLSSILLYILLFTSCENDALTNIDSANATCTFDYSQYNINDIGVYHNKIIKDAVDSLLTTSSNLERASILRYFKNQYPDSQVWAFSDEIDTNYVNNIIPAWKQLSNEDIIDSMYHYNNALSQLNIFQDEYIKLAEDIIDIFANGDPCNSSFENIKYELNELSTATCKFGELLVRALLSISENSLNLWCNESELFDKLDSNQVQLRFLPLAYLDAAGGWYGSMKFIYENRECMDWGCNEGTGREMLNAAGSSALGASGLGWL